MFGTNSAQRKGAWAERGAVIVMSKTGDPEMHGDEEAMIEEIMRHLDAESSQGVVRMSVTMDEEAEEAKQVSHKCCHMYGRPANETVGMLDMYTDMAGGEA
mgnify:CR=1 FL=1